MRLLGEMSITDVTGRAGWNKTGDTLTYGSGSGAHTYHKVASATKGSVKFNGEYYSPEVYSSESAKSSTYPSSGGLKQKVELLVLSADNAYKASDAFELVELADKVEAYDSKLASSIREVVKINGRGEVPEHLFRYWSGQVTNAIRSVGITGQTAKSLEGFSSTTGATVYKDVVDNGDGTLSVTVEQRKARYVPGEYVSKPPDDEAYRKANLYMSGIVGNFTDGVTLDAMASLYAVLGSDKAVQAALKDAGVNSVSLTQEQANDIIKKKTTGYWEFSTEETTASLSGESGFTIAYPSDEDKRRVLSDNGITDKDIQDKFLMSYAADGINEAFAEANTYQGILDTNESVYRSVLWMSNDNNLKNFMLSNGDFAKNIAEKYPNLISYLAKGYEFNDAACSDLCASAIVALNRGVSYEDLTDEQKQAIAEAGGPLVDKKYKKPYRPDHFHMQFGGDNIMNAGGVGEEGRAYYSIWDTPVKALNYFTSDKNYPMYCGINSRYTSSGSGISYHAAAFAFTITQPSKVSFIWHYRRLNNRPGSGPFRWRIVPWQENDPVRKYNGVNWSGSTHGWLDAARKVKSTIWNINHYGTEFYEDVNGKVRARPSQDFIDGGQFYYNGSNKKVKDNDPSVSGDMEITAVVDAQHFNLGVIYPDAIDGHSQNDMDKYVKQHCVSGSQYNVTFSCRDIGEIVETRATFTCSDINDQSTWRWETVEGYPEIPRRFAIVVYPPYYANDNKRYQYFDVKKLNLGYTQNYCSINYTDEPDNIIDFYHMPHEDRYNTVCYGVQGRNRSPANLLIYGGSEPYYGNGISTYICTNTASGRKYLPYEMYIHNGSGITEYWNYIDADTTVDANVGYTYDEAQYYYQVHKLNPEEIDLLTI